MKRGISLLVLLLVAGTAAAQTLVLVTVSHSNIMAAMGDVVKRIFAQAGLNAQVEFMPAARATKDATSGRVDGEVGRVEEYGLQNPNMLKVIPSYYTYSISAFYHKPLIIQSTSDLQGHSVSYIRGLPSHESVAKIGTTSFAVNSYDSVFTMVAKGHAEVGLSNTLVGIATLGRLGYGDFSHTELSNERLYIYLNEKHKDLLPLLSAAIRRMQISGELKKLIANAEQSFLLQ